MLVNEIKWHLRSLNQEQKFISHTHLLKDDGVFISLYEDSNGQYKVYIYSGGRGSARDCYVRTIDLLTLACLIVDARNVVKYP
jgi:hypothetical protein